MIHSKFDSLHAACWTTRADCAVAGRLFYREEAYEGDRLAALVSSSAVRDRWTEFLREAMGFFSIVSWQGGKLRAAVDRMRAFPLFYAVRDDDLYISNDARWVLAEVPSEMDPAAEAEFLQAGFVTGPDTLFPTVKQLQAGEALFAELTSPGPRIETERYFRYVHGEFFEPDPDEIIRRMGAMYDELFRRFVRWVDGRTIVLPLSGGYDSRIIVLQLAALKCENVICFSYGVPDNWEATYARQIAERLGFAWHFVPYSNEKWLKWFHSPEREAYDRFGTGLVSMTHEQDFPAVWELKNRRVLPDDSIIVPGHTAIAGCHIPEQLERASPIGADRIVEAIRLEKYNFQDVSGRGNEYWADLAEKIRDELKGLPTDTVEDAASAFECWEWQERQAKRQVNSIRCYEFWGFGWDLPLWDLRAMEFWQKVPYEFRKEKWLFRRYVDDLGEKFGFPKPPKPWMYKVRQVLAPLGLERLARRFKNRQERTRHMLAFQGIIPDELWDRYRKEVHPFISYHLDVTLEDIRRTCQS